MDSVMMDNMRKMMETAERAMTSTGQKINGHAKVTDGKLEVGVAVDYNLPASTLSVIGNRLLLFNRMMERKMSDFDIGQADREIDYLLKTGGKK